MVELGDSPGKCHGSVFPLVCLSRALEFPDREIRGRGARPCTSVRGTMSWRHCCLMSSNIASPHLVSRPATAPFRFLVLLAGLLLSISLSWSYAMLPVAGSTKSDFLRAIFACSERYLTFLVVPDAVWPSSLLFQLSPTHGRVT